MSGWRWQATSSKNEKGKCNTVSFAPFSVRGLSHGSCKKERSLRSLKPSPKLRTNKRFDSFSPCQMPPELAAFALNSNADIKKWAARVLQRFNLGQCVVGFRAPGKFKVITVGQLPNCSK